MLLLLHELVDDPAQREQTGIDHACFPGATLDGSTATDVLGPGEVDQVQLADFEEVLASRAGRFLNVQGDGEDGMRATARVR